MSFGHCEAELDLSDSESEHSGSEHSTDSNEYNSDNSDRELEEECLNISELRQAITNGSELVKKFKSELADLEIQRIDYVIESSQVEILLMREQILITNERREFLRNWVNIMNKMKATIQLQKENPNMEHDAEVVKYANDIKELDEEHLAQRKKREARCAELIPEYRAAQAKAQEVSNKAYAVAQKLNKVQIRIPKELVDKLIICPSV